MIALQAEKVPLPRHEFWALLESASGRSREYWLARKTIALGPQAEKLFFRWVDQRKAGTPLAYLLGWREFYARKFWVNRHTLIPRAETELLIDLAKKVLKERPEFTRLCDLGTGSGCIAITLALECPQVRVTASDISEFALEVARNNSAWLGATRVEFTQGSWWEAHGRRPTRYHGVIANPPYVARGDPHLHSGDLPYEPRLALTGKPLADEKTLADCGLGAYREILGGIKAHLEPGGFVLIEHGHTQQAQVMGLFQEAGLDGICGFSDAFGTPRAVLGFLKARP